MAHLSSTPACPVSQAASSSASAQTAGPIAGNAFCVVSKASFSLASRSFSRCLLTCRKLLNQCLHTSDEANSATTHHALAPGVWCI